jgi:hypothetical protein
MCKHGHDTLRKRHETVQQSHEYQSCDDASEKAVDAMVIPLEIFQGTRATVMAELVKGVLFTSRFQIFPALSGTRIRYLCISNAFDCCWRWKSELS